MAQYTKVFQLAIWGVAWLRKERAVLSYKSEIMS